MKATTTTGGLSSSSWVLLLLLPASVAFIHHVAPNKKRPLNNRKFVSDVVVRGQKRTTTLLLASEKEDDGTNNKKADPYADFPENYTDLEFIDYSDPEYKVDQGISDEFFDTEKEIDNMREERRRKNDEYQFQTYFAEVLKDGREYMGQWTIYKTSTFLDEINDEDNGAPKVVRLKNSLKVVSKGSKIKVDTTEEDSEYDVDKERICHEQRLVPSAEETTTARDEETAREIMANTHWPDELKAIDFRGEQGTMVCGASYTVCKSVPIGDSAAQIVRSSSESSNYEYMVGPFAEHYVELGIKSKKMRFRVKLDYQTKESELTKFLQESSSAPPPALCLKSLIVCREALGCWPPNPEEDTTSDDPDINASALWGLPGAEGGLYDPPLVGSDERAERCYMLLDLEGRATLLFPHTIEQASAPTGEDEGNGWVTSLDWAPDTQRYQVDRKVKSGQDVMSLRSLELSEVQTSDAERYRPRDGGANMRQ